MAQIVPKIQRQPVALVFLEDTWVASYVVSANIGEHGRLNEKFPINGIPRSKDQLIFPKFVL